MEALCPSPLEAAPDDFPAAAEALDATHVAAAALGETPAGAVAAETPVAAAAQRDGSHVAVEAQAVTHAAAEARLAEPAGAAYCVACPDAIAAGVPAGILADVPAVQGASAEFLADEMAVAVSSAALPADDYFRVALVAVLAGDCSPAVCQGIGAAAAPEEPQMAGGERCDCWAPERYGSRVRRDGRCPRERCDFPEEQADCQERRAEHCHWGGRDHCCLGRHCSGRRYPGDQGAAHCDFRERPGVGCCLAVRDDSPAVQDVGPLRGCLAHSVARQDGCRVDYLAVRLAAHSAVRDVALPRGCQERSVDPGDSLPHLAVQDDWVGR